jgi:hypothetical protein
MAGGIRISDPEIIELSHYNKEQSSRIVLFEQGHGGIYCDPVMFVGFLWGISQSDQQHLHQFDAYIDQALFCASLAQC